MTQERKSVDEMLDWLGLDTDAKAIEDREALNTDEEYCKLYDDAEWAATGFYDMLSRYKRCWQSNFDNWKNESRNFTLALHYANLVHSYLRKWKAEYRKARQAFADFVAAENAEWLAEAV